MEDISKAEEFCKRIGIKQENIFKITDSTRDPFDGKPYLESSKIFGSKITKLTSNLFGGCKGKKFLFVYMSGHGASKDCQFFLLNAKDDVCFPVESKMRATSEAYDVNVFAIYDICRSNLEDYQYNKGIE